VKDPTPVCALCGLVDDNVCGSNEDAEGCPHHPRIQTGPLAGLKRRHYGTIYADPPWSFLTYTHNKDGVVPHRTEDAPYSAMSAEDLMALPVGEIAAKDCLLHMWVISSHFDQALALAARWGFTYKSLGFVWTKTQKGDPETPKMGMGMWLRQDSEVSLVFAKGKPSRVSKGVRQAILEPAREHSRKPDVAYERVEALTAGPYCELFSRTSRAGWDQMGNQKGLFDKLDPVELDDIEGMI